MSQCNGKYATKNMTTFVKFVKSSNDFQLLPRLHERHLVEKEVN